MTSSLLRQSVSLWIGCCAALACVPRADLDEYSNGREQSAGGGPSQAPPDAGWVPGDAGGSARSSDAGSAAQPSGVSDAAAPAAAPSDAAGASQPRVLATVPADGAIGVPRDTTLSIAFDEPMNRASVEAAFLFDSLPQLALEFRWDPSGTQLDVVLESPLAYASGSDANVTAQRYDYRITSAARDLEGHALPETRVSFTTLRELTTRVSALADAAQTGNWRSDGIYGTDPCSQAGASVCLGDSSFGPNASYRVFATFDLSVLPAAAVDVSRARFELQVASLLGDPVAGLGPLLLEQVQFAAIGPDAYLAQAEAQLGSMTAITAGTTLSFDVLSALRADWRDAAPAQYRLRFQSQTDLDGSTDLLFSTRASASLSVSYLMP